MNGLTVLGLSRPFGPDHLRPPRAADAVRLRPRLRVRQMPRVKAHAALEQPRPAPHREVARVPQVHLGVELAVPAVGEQAFFLRREPAGGVHRHQELRQDDAALQLARARIGAAGEVHDTAVVPVRGPRRGYVGAGGFGAREQRRRRRIQERDEQRYGVAAASGDAEGVRPAFGRLDVAVDGHADGVAHVVDLPRERQAARVAALDVRLVRLGVRPVGRIRIELAADAGKRQIDAETARGDAAASAAGRSPRRLSGARSSPPPLSDRRTRTGC